MVALLEQPPPPPPPPASLREHQWTLYPPAPIWFPPFVNIVEPLICRNVDVAIVVDWVVTRRAKTTRTTTMTIPILILMTMMLVHLPPPKNRTALDPSCFLPKNDHPFVNQIPCNGMIKMNGLNHPHPRYHWTTTMKSNAIESSIKLVPPAADLIRRIPGMVTLCLRKVGYRDCLVVMVTRTAKDLLPTYILAMVGWLVD